MPATNDDHNTNKKLWKSMEAYKVDSILVIDIAYHYHILAPEWLTFRETAELITLLYKQALCIVSRLQNGEVSEWLKEHAWKVCKRL